MKPQPIPRPNGTQYHPKKLWSCNISDILNNKELTFVAETHNIETARKYLLHIPEYICPETVWIHEFRPTQEDLDDGEYEFECYYLWVSVKNPEGNRSEAFPAVVFLYSGGAPYPEEIAAKEDE